MSTVQPALFGKAFSGRLAAPGPIDFSASDNGQSDFRSTLARAAKPSDSRVRTTSKSSPDNRDSQLVRRTDASKAQHARVADDVQDEFQDQSSTDRQDFIAASDPETVESTQTASDAKEQDHSSASHPSQTSTRQSATQDQTPSQPIGIAVETTIAEVQPKESRAPITMSPRPVSVGPNPDGGASKTAGSVSGDVSATVRLPSPNLNSAVSVEAAVTIESPALAQGTAQSQPHFAAVAQSQAASVPALANQSNAQVQPDANPQPQAGSSPQGAATTTAATFSNAIAFSGGPTTMSAAVESDQAAVSQSEVARDRGPQRSGTGADAARNAPAAPPSQLSPAAARALQVETSVQLENLTSQTSSSAGATQVIAHPGAANHASVSLDALIKGDSGAQHLPVSGAPLEDAPFTGQVVRGLAAMVNQRGGIMNMRLDPPDLGELRVNMTLSRGVVTAEFQTSTQQAQTLLEKNLAALRLTLESQGLTVDRLSVHAAPSNGQHLMQDDGNNSSPGQHRHAQHDAAGGESRGRRDGGASDHESPRFFDPADFAKLLDGFEHVTAGTTNP